MRETDFLTNILARRISQLSDGIDLLRTLEQDFRFEKSVPSSSGFGNKNNEMTVMVDFANKDDYVKFLGKIKSLGIKKIRFHYILVSLVIYFKSL